MTRVGPPASFEVRDARATARQLRRAPRQPFARDVPTWPMTVVLIGMPVWWLSGIGDLAMPALASVMLVHLVRAGRIDVPRGFGLWLLFLAWMVCSVIQIDDGGRLLGFIWRALMYGAVTVFFLYVYNGRTRLTVRYIAGVLTGFWLIVVAGGYLGILFPVLTITTPMAHLMPDFLLSNDLVSEMVYRRTTQFNPTSVLELDARPSAPFLYTNGWGNAYSLLMPIVVAYIAMVRGERKFWWLLVALPVSFVPAFLTLNRGMFTGLVLALVYVTLRLALRGRLRAAAVLVVLLAVGALVFTALPIEERLSYRLNTSSSTVDRLNLYQEAVDRAIQSPVFGYGAPRPSETPDAPSVGTQGQLWLVMFSHGFPGAALFMGWLVWMFVRTFRYRDYAGLACNATLLVITVESVYYGVLTTGLPIAMIAAGLAMRPEEAIDSAQPATPERTTDDTR